MRAGWWEGASLGMMSPSRGIGLTKTNFHQHQGAQGPTPSSWPRPEGCIYGRAAESPRTITQRRGEPPKHSFPLQAPNKSICSSSGDTADGPLLRRCGLSRVELPPVLPVPAALMARGGCRARGAAPRELGAGDAQGCRGCGSIGVGSASSGRFHEEGAGQG